MSLPPAQSLALIRLKSAMPPLIARSTRSGSWQLDRIISEQQLTSTAHFDKAGLAEVGKVLGVDAILTGTIADLGSTIKILRFSAGMTNIEAR
jgi:hypothetical protein